MLDSEEAFQWTIGLGGDFSAGNSSVVDLTLDGGCAWAFEAWEVKASGAWARVVVLEISVPQCLEGFSGHLNFEIDVNGLFA